MKSIKVNVQDDLMGRIEEYKKKKAILTDAQAVRLLILEGLNSLGIE